MSERPDTTPLYIQMGMTRVIVQDKAQRELDIARDQHRRAYNRGYSLSERGDSEKAQRILDNANAALRAAEERYAELRRRGGRAA